MATPSQCLASMARLTLSSSRRPIQHSVPRITVPLSVETRRYKGTGNKMQIQANRRRKEEAKKDKKKLSKEFSTPSLVTMEQFSLIDAMRTGGNVRFIRAVEVGKPPSMVKYDLALRLKTNRNARPVRNRLILPHPVKMSSRIIVVCPENSKIAEEALAAGAVAAGEESLFEQIRSKKLKFGKVIAHTDSFGAMQRARLGPILRNLMPSPRTKTVTANVPKLIKEMSSAEQYRERQGTVRVCIGQLSFTPQMLANNVKALVSKVKGDMEQMDDDGVNSKSLHEVVLSSTNGPGLSLDGGFLSTDPNVTEEHITGPM
ncbi:50s ribosomal protein l1 [Zalerion maritima]|uniref:50s ribosomal protein l1 n=1 Tax=Zalerion maritima TaxID=339359 RepID=A0AAD5WM88_9PEZI|nr:50s ribosomal protein l1 [Zalerion maritima]